MHTIARILAPLLIAAGLLAGTQGAATADVPTCDPGDYYALQVHVTDLEHQLTRQAERHADELDDLNDLLLEADRRATDQTNAHAEELAGVFRQLDDANAATWRAEAEALEERDERLDAEAELARAERRIARLLARVAALKASR